MGNQPSASSRNVAKIANSISNTVNNQTTIRQTTRNTSSNTIELNNCSVEGDVNANQVASVIAQAEQYAEVETRTMVDNAIANELKQVAESTMGFLATGRADAENITDLQNQIQTTVQNEAMIIANTITSGGNNFDCTNSRIGGSINIGQELESGAFSEQIASVVNESTIINDIANSIDQSASAEVKGLGDMIGDLLRMLMVVLLVVVAAGAIFVMFGTKLFEMAIDTVIRTIKFAVPFLLVGGLTALGVWGLYQIYWVKWFEPHNGLPCFVDAANPRCGTYGDGQLVECRAATDEDDPDNQLDGIRLSNPPEIYRYPLFRSEMDTLPGLLGRVLVQKCSWTNTNQPVDTPPAQGGTGEVGYIEDMKGNRIMLMNQAYYDWRCDSWDRTANVCNRENGTQYKPNKMLNPDLINEDAWVDNDWDLTWTYLRRKCAEILRMDTTVLPGREHEWVPDNQYERDNSSRAMWGPGILKGDVGRCDTNRQALRDSSEFKMAATALSWCLSIGGAMLFLYMILLMNKRDKVSP